jgi:FkbM family methyltransferase
VDPCVLFLHIPRTGGTTIGSAAYHLYQPSKILELHPATRAREILEGVPEEGRRQLRFIRGHFPFGIHELLAVPCLYVTVLRDPVERVLSLYGYIRSDPTHPFYDTTPRRDVSLEEFLDLRPGPTRDVQTSLLAGVPPWDDSVPRDATTLARAKENLEGAFEMVGLTERFDETLELMRRVLGWRIDSVGSANVVPGRARRDDLDPSVVSLIEERNQLDLELYEFAAGLFPRQAGWSGEPPPSPEPSGETGAPVAAPVGKTPTTARRARERLKRALPGPVVRGIQGVLARLRGRPPEPLRAGERVTLGPFSGGYWTAPVVMRRLEAMAENGYRPSVVLDVGAAHGRWTADCMQIYPAAQYVLVEPGPDYTGELEEFSRDPRVSYVPAAAGPERGRGTLLLPEDPQGASLLPATRDKDYFARQVEVPVVALDELDLPGEVSLLKLDVQGYELEVLRGAGRVLSEAEVVVCEASFHRFQEAIPLAHEVVVALAEAGFRPFDYGDEVRWPGSKLLAQLDLIFVREGSDLLRPQLWS